MKNVLGKSLVGKGMFPTKSVLAKEYYTYSRQDKIWIKKPNNQMDKQVELNILSCCVLKMLLLGTHHPT
jgi:hypothetical protein